MSRALFTMNVTSLGAPLQLEGTVGGAPWYFRARHGRWRVEVGDDMVMAEGDGDPTIQQAVSIVIGALWSHFMLPQINADEDVAYARNMLSERFGWKGGKHRGKW